MLPVELEEGAARAELGAIRMAAAALLADDHDASLRPGQGSASILILTP
jgi:hypothetical protein